MTSIKYINLVYTFMVASCFCQEVTADLLKVGNKWNYEGITTTYTPVGTNSTEFHLVKEVVSDTIINGKHQFIINTTKNDSQISLEYWYIENGIFYKNNKIIFDPSIKRDTTFSYNSGWGFTYFVNVRIDSNYIFNVPCSLQLWGYLQSGFMISSEGTSFSNLFGIIHESSRKDDYIINIEQESTLIGAKINSINYGTISNVSQNSINNKLITFNLYPNPFNSSIQIEIELAEPSPVYIEILDVLGRQVNLLYNDFLSNGNIKLIWHGTDYNGLHCMSGVYLCVMRTLKYQEVKRILLLN